MKIPAMIGNAEGYSIWTDVELPMKQINPRRLVSARQDATDWGLNTINNPGDRFGRMPLTANAIAGVTQIHAPRIVFCLAGHRDLQAGYDPKKKQFTGETRRLGPGQFNYVYGLGSHRPSGIATMLPLTFANTGKWDGKNANLTGVFK